MTSTHCARSPRWIRWNARAWIDDAKSRHHVRERLARARELARNLSISEVGSLLFFLALILLTFTI